MKEYRYITFKPNTSESQTELFSEMQYSMKNFDLKDCDELEQYIDFEKSKLVINVCLNEYDNLYSCNTVAQAPLEVIDQLGINSVLIGALENGSVQEMQQEKYKRIYRILKGIVKDASGKSDEYTRFITVYKRLARILTYDNEQVERENEGSYDEDEFYNSRNLENGLLKL